MQSLAITKVDLYKLFIPLKEPFIISLGPLYNAESVVVRMETSAGITGWGECSPFMSINGESADTGLVVGRYLERILLGRDPLAIGDRILDMDGVIYGNKSIKSAFDMALYDIAAKHAGQPLYRFLGGNRQKEIATDYTVSVGTPAKMAADALKIKARGFPVIKVKIGKGGAQDVERIRAIREAVGIDIPLRVDANQGWHREEAIETLKALEPFNIQHCEEPIARWEFMELPKIKAQSPIPIMADETCGDQHDVQRLIDLGACDRINIKLGKSGGIYNALEMIRLAEAANMEIQIGAFLESRLAMTAFAHLACCSPNIVYFDFDTALMFSEDPVEGGMQYKENGIIDVPDAPGIGAVIREDFLKSVV
ncbi:mandelate racemase/muconate lactonizing enzyme family protein [Niabella drilacis]|uniref:Dipeptide epimerase n=1 Tax=Niabella drilacis (strain DSM 25811 / CCM 8410 / CCUG 62505 / LMG 26954 / E90) TaxID=1285928 RepID=A0A1G6XY96_NIADE|nr:dipeptide epimerase [Niabella drilacis]SDD82365.1 L-alanine-DL-glutamate epimerase [Niabella drilacis]